MTIDTTGKWWTGTSPTDLQEYLEAYSGDHYKVTEFRLSTCSCGSQSFYLEADDDSGVAMRTCTQCSEQHFICDSQKFWNEAQPKKWRCIKKCGSRIANVGIGFSLYEEDGEVHWLYVGERCVVCGILGCFAGWKVGYAPSKHLLDQA